jgi:hypothetical protein
MAQQLLLEKEAGKRWSRATFICAAFARCTPYYITCLKQPPLNAPH